MGPGIYSAYTGLSASGNTGPWQISNTGPDFLLVEISTGTSKIFNQSGYGVMLILNCNINMGTTNLR